MLIIALPNSGIAVLVSSQLGIAAAHLLIPHLFWSAVPAWLFRESSISLRSDIKATSPPAPPNLYSYRIRFLRFLSTRVAQGFAVRSSDSEFCRDTFLGFLWGIGGGVGSQSELHLSYCTSYLSCAQERHLEVSRAHISS